MHGRSRCVFKDSEQPRTTVLSASTLFLAAKTSQSDPLEGVVYETKAYVTLELRKLETLVTLAPETPTCAQRVLIRINDVLILLDVAGR